MKTISKYYSKEDNCFYIIKQSDKYSEPEVLKYLSLEEFAKACKNNFTNVDFLDYCFTLEELNKYDVKNAKISSSTMKKLHMYDNRLFKSISNTFIPSFNKTESLDTLNKPLENDYLSVFNYSSIYRFNYISDLHLDIKISNKFSSQINIYELEKYLTSIILKIKESLVPGIVLFLGDITHNLTIFKSFFTIYEKHIENKTFIILGNHELYQDQFNQFSNQMEEKVLEYKTILNQISPHIKILQNEIYLSRKKIIISQKQLLELTEKELKRKLSNNQFLIFGGIGFSGKNNCFNADNNIYNNPLIDRSSEIQYSQTVDTIHEKLNNCTPMQKIIFCTHMPMKDWSNKKHNPNWIYLHGHTHQNFFIKNTTQTIYADNQVGYKGELFQCKNFADVCTYNIFQYYKDGIYEISKKQYKSFYNGLGLYMEINRDFDKIFLIKKNSTYCFLAKTPNSNQLKLLRGGSITNVGNHDLQYFYTNIDNYCKSINKFIDSYQESQLKISKLVKEFGGNGHIHGCIIDIDPFNHLYINPFDGTITPYFAYDTINKYVYKNLDVLLQERNPLLHKNLLTLSASNSLIKQTKTKIRGNKKYFPDTDMYTFSALIKSFQYLKNYNIVRVWSDKFTDFSSEDFGKLIFKESLSFIKK